MPGDESVASALVALARGGREKTAINANGNATIDNDNTTTNEQMHPPREQALLDGLKQLDDEYQEMWEQKRVLFDALENLETDEQVLTHALAKVQEPPKPIQRPMNKEAKVMQRLQDALLAAGSSSEDGDDDDESESDDSNDS